MKLGHWERLVLVLSACRLAPDPVHQSPRCHRKALFESMPSFLRVLIMTKEVKGFAYSRNGWCLKVKLRTLIPAFSSRGQAALQPLIQTLDYSWLLKAGVGTVVDPLICGYFSIVNMLLLILGPWLIEPVSVEQPQIRKADYKLHVDPRIYYINACWVTERPNLIADDCPKLSTQRLSGVGCGAGRRWGACSHAMAPLAG